MKFLVELSKSAAWICGFLGGFYCYINEEWLWFGAVVLTACGTIYWAADWLSHQDYQDRLDEYAAYKMPIFIVQDPERKLPVDAQARMVREALAQSGNTLLNAETDVHEVYYQDPRHKAAVETPAEYLTRVEAYKKKTTEDFMNRQLKQVGDFSYFKSIYFNQDLTPPEPVDRRFRLFNWG